MTCTHPATTETDYNPNNQNDFFLMKTKNNNIYVLSLKFISINDIVKNAQLEKLRTPQIFHFSLQLCFVLLILTPCRIKYRKKEYFILRKIRNFFFLLLSHDPN